MSLKNYFKPDWKKILIFFIIVALANIPFIGYFIENKECQPGFSSCTVYKSNPVLWPAFLLLPLISNPIETISMYTYNRIFVLIFYSALYWYFIACSILWIIEKIRSERK